MRDLEAVELGDTAARLFPQGTEVGGVDLVLALDLVHHQLGVGDDAEVLVAVGQGPGEAAEETGVLGEVVGAMAEKLGEFGELVACGVGEDGSEAGRARVAASSAVAVGGDPVFAAGVWGVVEEAGGAWHDVQSKCLAVHR